MKHSVLVAILSVFSAIGGNDIRGNDTTEKVTSGSSRWEITWDDYYETPEFWEEKDVQIDPPLYYIDAKGDEYKFAQNSLGELFAKPMGDLEIGGDITIEGGTLTATDANGLKVIFGGPANPRTYFEYNEFGWEKAIISLKKLDSGFEIFWSATKQGEQQMRQFGTQFITDYPQRRFRETWIIKDTRLQLLKPVQESKYTPTFFIQENWHFDD